MISASSLASRSSTQAELAPSGGTGMGMSTGPATPAGASWICAAVGVSIPARVQVVANPLLSKIDGERDVPCPVRIAEIAGAAGIAFGRSGKGDGTDLPAVADMIGISGRGDEGRRTEQRSAHSNSRPSTTTVPFKSRLWSMPKR